MNINRILTKIDPNLDILFSLINSYRSNAVIKKKKSTDYSDSAQAYFPLVPKGLLRRKRGIKGDVFRYRIGRSQV